MVLLRIVFGTCWRILSCRRFRKRYNSEQLKELNNVVKIRDKIRTAKLSTKFLDACKTHHIVPSFIDHRIKAAKVQQTSTMERAFLQDEIGKNSTKLQRLRPIYTRCWKKVRSFLSFFDWLRFCRYLAQIESVKQKQIRVKHFNTVNWLRKQRFGISVSLSDENIINLSDYNLSETERYVLAHSLEFYLPPSNIKREVFAEFEILLSQLLHHKPKTSDKLILLKAKLNEVAHSFCGSRLTLLNFLWIIAVFKQLNHSGLTKQS